MTPDDRRRLRAALRIHETLIASAGPPPAPLLPIPDWRDLERSARLAAVADSKGWPRAAASGRAEGRRLAAALADRLADYARALECGERVPRVQSPREVAADLAALGAEFEEVAIDLRETTVSVTTDEVVLKGVDLGRFKVVLHWGRGDGLDYDVLALDPNPAGSDDSVTHPHVRDDALCEGEGRVPIGRALREGRVYDLFLLVRQVLGAYNAGSAYVPLSRWHGSPCADCGYTADEDESSSCDRCGEDLCLDCGEACGDCGRTLCGGCRDRCPGCDEAHCSACLRDCRSCGEPSCRECMPGPTCESCAEESERNHEPASPEGETHERDHDADDPGDATNGQDHDATKPPAPSENLEPTGAAFHAVRLGEAAVPA